MKLVVNDMAHEHRGDGSIPALFSEIGAAPERTALMVNGEVVPRTDWPACRLAENDRIELLVLAGGG